MGIVNNVLDWFKKLFGDINSWMASIFRFDEKILDLYGNFIAPLPEWIKIVGLIFILIALVLGVIQLIKKAFKLVIVLLIVFAIIALITWL